MLGWCATKDRAMPAVGRGGGARSRDMVLTMSLSAAIWPDLMAVFVARQSAVYEGVPSPYTHGDVFPNNFAAVRVCERARPESEKSSSLEGDVQNKMRRQCMQKLLKTCMLHDDYIAPTLAALENGLVNIITLACAVGQGRFWHSTYTRFKLLSKYWRAEFFTKLDIGPSVEDIHGIGYQDADAASCCSYSRRTCCPPSCWTKMCARQPSP